MNAIRNAYLMSIPALLVLIAIGSWWMSGSRVSIQDSDREFIELLEVFNQMMERLDRSFTQASRFSADAAHELKTPLSILQGELERTLHAVDPGSELQQRLSGLLDEIRHLSTIVRKLLLLSLADAGQMCLHTTKVDLSALLTDLVDDIEMLSPDLKLQVQGISHLTIYIGNS
jgi:two-component system, OmpR family, heavy metal sensor histidine kinase CusS